MDASSALLDSDLVVGKDNLGARLVVGDKVKRLALLASGWVIVTLERPGGIERIGLPPQRVRQLGQVQDSLGPALRPPKASKAQTADTTSES